MSKIAIDFDNTIFNKEAGEIITGACESINKLSVGNEITIFTTRPDYDYSTIKRILIDNNICYDRIICGKPSYNILIDDRARQFKGWDKDYENIN